MELGRQLQKCREDRRVTQQEMADACGLSKNYISAMERGVNKCNAHTLIAYAEKLDMSLDDLVGKTDRNKILPELLSVLGTCDRQQQLKILQMVKLMLN